MIELKDVSKFYNANGITNIGIQNINLKLSKGEIVAITGESGSGKSTLLNVITKIDTFDEGEILYKGNATSYFNISDMDDFRKNKVGFIFQNYNILDSYTVLDNVKLPLLLKGVSDEEAEKQALRLISKVGLSSKIKSRGSKLSGGEKQRCVIARALASDCEILACDEPTGNLDSKTAKEIIELINEISQDKLVLIVTHNFSEVEGIATRRLKVSDGRIVEDIDLKETHILNDVNEELNLDYQPIPRKICRKISLSNIKFTPKKTILVAIIFFVISFVTFALLQVVNSAMMSSYYYNTCNVTFDNYMTVYKEDASVIDVKLLEGYDYEVNSFAYEQTLYVSFGEYYQESILLNNHVPNSELVFGHMPENDNEVLLYISDNYGSYYWYEDYLNEKIRLNKLGDEIKTDFVVSGICRYEDATCYSHFLSGSDKFANFMNNVCVNYVLKVNVDNEAFYPAVVFSTEKSTGLYIDKSYQSQKVELINCYIEQIYEMNVKNIPVNYVEDQASMIFYINPYDDLKIEPYFISLDINAKKLTSIKLDLAKKGLKVNYPFVDGEEKTTKLIGKVLSFIVNLELSAYLIGIFFIAYNILAKIFESRIKDYEILRTLGVTKRDMRRIVNTEILSIGFVMMTLALITGYVLIYTIKVFKFMRTFSLGALIIYLLVLSLFILAMAKRFNKKLFKFSVRKSFEGEEDD